MAKYPNSERREKFIRSADNILSSTVQLFLLKSHQRVPHGCGVLFTCNDKHYLLSNSHVLDKSKFPEVYFLLDNIQPVLLKGGLFYSKENLEGRDTLDIAIMELAPATKAIIAAYGLRFLTLAAIETAVQLIANNVLMVAAYPANTTDLDVETNRFKFKPTILQTRASTKSYESIGYPSSDHHVIKYPRKSLKEVSTGNRVIAPLPHGMSGSGLWLMIGPSFDQATPHLIGILSEYDDVRALIIATRIEIFLSIMKQLFDPALPYDGVQVRFFEH